MKKVMLLSLLVVIFTVGMVFSNSITLWDVETSSVLGEIVEEHGEMFEALNPGYDFKVVHIQNDPYKTKLKVAMGAGTPPDLFYTWGGGPLLEYINSGMVQPLDEIEEALRAKFIPSAFSAITFDGHVYAVPWQGLTGVFFWYRKDIFEKYGLEVPTTLVEFEAVCETLKDNSIIPIALAGKNKWTESFYYMYLADRFGGEDAFKDAWARKEGASFDSESFVKAAQTIQDWVNKDYFPRGFNGMDEDTGAARVLIYSGKAAMYLMGTWFPNTYANENPEIAEKLGFFNFPAVEDGKGNPTNLIGSAGQGFMALTTTSKEKIKAMDFLRNYIEDPIWIEKSVASGLVPPVKHAASYVAEDALLSSIASEFSKANHVQMYYDQYLPPELGEAHKDIVQKIFGLNVTPEESAKEHEEAVVEFLSR
jgi:raffinose/stachyose/melibiose transport system substrate-binding protein